MATKHTQSAFEKANRDGDLSAAVQLARVAFKTKMFTGVLEDDPGSLVELLLDDESERPPAALTGEVFDYHCRHLFAAMAMGIAIGQLLSPDVFAKGGTR